MLDKTIKICILGLLNILYLEGKNGYLQWELYVAIIPCIISKCHGAYQPLVLGLVLVNVCVTVQRLRKMQRSVPLS